MTDKLIKSLIFCLVILLAFSAGVYIGRLFTYQALKPQIITRAKILNEVDQKFAQKIKKGLLLFPFFKEELPEGISSFSGKIVEIDKENKTIKVEMPNLYRGGKITNFLYQPDYYLKIISVDKDTKIEKKGRDIGFENLKKGQSVFVGAKKRFRLNEEKIEAKVVRIISD